MNAVPAVGDGGAGDGELMSAGSLYAIRLGVLAIDLHAIDHGRELTLPHILLHRLWRGRAFVRAYEMQRRPRPRHDQTRGSMAGNARGSHLVQING